MGIFARLRLAKRQPTAQPNSLCMPLKHDKKVSLGIRSNFRIPGHFIYICWRALKNEVYSNSFYSYSNEVAEVAGYSEV